MKSLMIAILALGATSAFAAGQNVTVFFATYTSTEMYPAGFYQQCSDYENQINPELEQVEKNLTGAAAGVLTLKTAVSMSGAPGPTAPGVQPQPMTFTCQGYYSSSSPHWGFAHSMTKEKDHLASGTEKTACDADLAAVQAKNNTFDAFLDSGWGLFSGNYCGVGYMEVDALN